MQYIKWLKSKIFDYKFFAYVLQLEVVPRAIFTGLRLKKM